MTGKGKTGSFSLSLSESAWEVLRILRVVLADDENKVILLMQKLIDWDFRSYRIPARLAELFLTLRSAAGAALYRLPGGRRQNGG